MKIRKLPRFTFFLILFGFILSCARIDYFVKKGVEFSRYKHVAVLTFTISKDMVKEHNITLSEGISDILATELLKRGWYVVERGRIKSIFEERNLELTQIPYGKSLEEVQSLLNVA